jgi:hypothetical protein
MAEQQIQINLANAPWMKCDCGGHFFRQTIMFKKLSQFESPSLKEEHIPVDLAVCEICGRVPSFVSDKIKGIPEDLLAIKSIIKDGE